MATNTNLVAEEIYPQAGADLKGYKVGYIDSGAKAAQNDTWTVKNASALQVLSAQLDATGAAEPHTISGNVITLTGATGTACSALIRYKQEDN